MAKRNFKPQRPARKAKIKTNAKLNVKTKAAERVKAAAKAKLNIKRKAISKTNKPAGKRLRAKQEAATENKNKASQWQLPPDYFDHLPPTHNAFIGYAQHDTLQNVMSGIDVIRELATIDPSGLMLDPDTCCGLLWFTQNLRNALRFEVEFRKCL